MTTGNHRGEVVSLDGRRKKGPQPALTVLAPPSCYPHQFFFFDAKVRSVTCQRCARHFDPFEALLYIARHWTNYSANLGSLQAETKRLAGVKERLQKDIQNLKAQLRRAPK